MLDITKLVDDLKAALAWDPRKLRATFAPDGHPQPDGKVKVDRVSVFYQ